MEILIPATILVFLLGTLYITYRCRKKEKFLNKVIHKWRNNPTEMDLNLATTEQIVKELLNRSQPFIMMMPEVPKINSEPIASVRLYVIGMHPEHAQALLQGAGELLAQSHSNDDIVDED